MKKIKDKPNLTILFVVIISLLVGALIGAYYQFVQDGSRSSSSVAASDAVKVLSSKAIGKVVGVQDRRITLTFSGETITVPINTDASVMTMVPAAPSATPQVSLTPEASSLSNIKPGDTVNISISVSPDGKAQGTSVLVYPINKKK